MPERSHSKLTVVILEPQSVRHPSRWLYQPFRSTDKDDDDRDLNVQPNHEPPHDVIAPPANSGNMNRPAVSSAAWQMITIGRPPFVLL